MRIEGAVAVVTGGASCIGRAIAAALLENGVAGVVIGDIDGTGAQAAAEELGPRALGTAVDVADPAATEAMIAAAENHFGPVDAYFSNAGLGAGEGLEPDVETWERVTAVNVTAHPIAARRLLPSWLERGAGHMVITASAAGLLSQIGSAPYATTKHAAVGFAEWMSITYGDRGIGVGCLCPMGVDTPLLHGGDADPDSAVAQLASQTVIASGDVLSPEAVAKQTLEAVEDGRFLILPHPEVLDYLRHKGQDYERWLAGMRRLQAQMLGSTPNG